MSNPENNTKVEKIAEKVISNIENKSGENFGFLITVLVITSIIINLIRILQECNKKKIGSFSQQEKCDYFGKEIKSLSIKPTWFTRLTTKKVIRKQLSREAYKTYGADIMQAVFKTGETLTDEEILDLVEASNV